MNRAPDELALLVEIADLIEQGVGTPYRKAERILWMMRRHEAETRDKQVMDWFAAHPHARPAVLADLATCTFTHTDQEDM